MNFKANRDGTYDIFGFLAKDLPQILRLIKQNEIWRKEETEKNLEIQELKETELPSPNTN